VLKRYIYCLIEFEGGNLGMGNLNQWDPDWEVSEGLVHNLICCQFPQLSSKQIQRLGYGWDNIVYLVGDEFVFRFPRRKVAIDLLRMEGKILPKLADFITIPYSKPVTIRHPFSAIPICLGSFQSD
jgi:aminoglycoside phosphotransferase (APT) family kinase protein